ncbi:MAG: phosphoribosylformylglycinamidine synthase subunit PurS [Chitinophagia bacterium]|nr:phosphoribosylformylglycinamidine synthase subunit PurS [Chitinophagia bacterium]
MNYIAHIYILPLPELLDPQGKAVVNGLHNLGITAVEDVRVGKYITVKLRAQSKAEAENLADVACKKLLVNAIMEKYSITIEEL